MTEVSCSGIVRVSIVINTCDISCEIAPVAWATCVCSTDCVTAHESCGKHPWVCVVKSILATLLDKPVISWTVIWAYRGSTLNGCIVTSSIIWCAITISGCVICAITIIAHVSEILNAIALWKYVVYQSRFDSCAALCWVWHYIWACRLGSSTWAEIISEHSAELAEVEESISIIGRRQSVHHGLGWNYDEVGEWDRITPSFVYSLDSCGIDTIS